MWPYQGLISHEKRYLGFHACVAKILPFFDVECFDQRTRTALLYLDKDNGVQKDKKTCLGRLCAPTCQKIPRVVHQLLRARVVSCPERLSLYDGH